MLPTIQENATITEVIFTGEKIGLLYVISVGEAYMKKARQIDNATIWHARSGHVEIIKWHANSK